MDYKKRKISQKNTDETFKIFDFYQISDPFFLQLMF